MAKKKKKKKNLKNKKRSSQKQARKKISVSNPAGSSAAIKNKKENQRQVSENKNINKNSSKKKKAKRKSISHKVGFAIGVLLRGFYDEISKPERLKLITYFSIVCLIIFNSKSYILNNLGVSLLAVATLTSLFFKNPAYIGLALSSATFIALPFILNLSLIAAACFVSGLLLIEMCFYVRDRKLQTGSKKTLIYSKAGGDPNIDEGQMPAKLSLLSAFSLSFSVFVAYAIMFIGSVLIFEPRVYLGFSDALIATFIGFYVMAGFFVSIIKYVPDLKRVRVVKNKKGKEIKKPKLVSIIIALLVILLPVAICYAAVFSHLPIRFMLCGVVVWNAHKVVEQFSDRQKSDEEIVGEINFLIVMATAVITFCLFS